MEHFVEFILVGNPGPEQTAVLVDALLHGYESAAENLLVVDGRFAAVIAHHVVDILDEYHIGVEVAEILDQCAVAARTEEEMTILAAGVPSRLAAMVSVDGFCTL